MAREPVLLARSIALLAVVVAASAGMLRAVDAIARSAAEPEGGRSFGSVADAERGLRTRLSLPAYFPARLRWPPTRVLGTGRGKGAVLLAFAAQSGNEELFIGQTLAGEGPIPEALWPAAVVLESSPVDACGEASRDGMLLQIHGEDGSLWHEVTCVQAGRRVALRSRGLTRELLRMAQSLRREGP